ncbi:MAG: hypothetical protein IJZ06_09615 [Bacteroidales bacterium]|nr:hypothetical protein [Bacteroidales bacterium]MBQ8761656.1 hypothetical protein [Bacteroidales bacterium]
MQFCKELEYSSLTDEQKRIYNAFVYRRSKPYKFEIIDKYDNTIRFVLCTNKLDDGVLHILLKHYQGVGKVNALEIVNFCDIIRKGDVGVSDNKMVYTLQRKGQTFKLVVALKKSKTGTNILKSFYSNR